MKPARRLVAIMFTDMVGFSALTYRDELLSRELVNEQRKIVRQYLSAHHGEEVDTTGDGFLIEFSSAVNAVQCAIEIQTHLFERSKHLGLDRKIQIRIGIHVGDVLVEGRQYLGNAVNIAARIEPLAKPGGICISKQVYDQISEKLPGIHFKKLGHQKLKNIKSGAELYHVTMPWQRAEARNSKFSQVLKRRWGLKALSISELLVGSLFAASLLILFAVLFRVQENTLQNQARLPAGAMEGKDPRVDLSEAWSFLVRPHSEGRPSSSDSAWKNFETTEYAQNANRIQGQYWLKKEFETQLKFQHPAFVLGLIPDRHRAFLNDRFIGGSDHLSDVAMYAFDYEALRTQAKNTILIQAEARPTLKPGLTILPKVGAFLSEFAVVREAVVKNQILFHLFRNMAFILALVIFISCFALALFQKSNKSYFYTSFYLLLGSIHLIYYTPWVSEAFSFELVRFLKLFSVMISSAVLCSGFLHINERKREELYNNILAVIFGIALCVCCLGIQHTPQSFVQVYNQILIGGMLYALLWPIYCFKLIPNPLMFSKHSSSNISWVYLMFGWLGLASLASSFANNWIPVQLDDVCRDLSVLLPFAFSIIAVFTGTREHIQKTRIALKEKHREELTLELVRLIRTASEPIDAIRAFQKKTSEFVGATKSRIYVFEDEKFHDSLRLVFAIDQSHASLQFKQNIDSKSGPVGYVIKNRTPLLIENIHKDSRFKISKGESRNYRTGTCMIFPLLSNSRLIGVLTFADKKADVVFSKSDYKTALELSSVLGLLLDNHHMREMLVAQSLVG